MTKIAVVTGTRAEYGLLKPVMREIQKKSTLQLIVTGMHLSRKHGLTYKIIEEDSFKIDKKVKMHAIDDTNLSMVKALGEGIKGIAKAVNDLDPDIVLVLGDRSEALAGAIAGAYLNKVVAHIHGGEVSKASIDESNRHAITKFAHIHFPATPTAARRIELLGERTENIYLVGAPGIDAITNKNYLDEYEVRQKYGLSEKPLVLVIQHPTTQEDNLADVHMRLTLEALKEVEADNLVIYPNNDAGGQAIINVIESSELPNNFKTYENVPREDFLGLMSVASAMVGNSSSGIIEAPSFHLPVVNIGLRQKGRLRVENVIDVPHEKEAIKQALIRAIFDKDYRKKIRGVKNPYGDGCSSKRIVKILNELVINNALIQKQITY